MKKSLGVIMVNGVPLEFPRAKTLGTCGTSDFGLGTSLGTSFTTTPPRFFQIMSQWHNLTGIKTLPELPTNITVISNRVNSCCKIYDATNLTSHEVLGEIQILK